MTTNARFHRKNIRLPAARYRGRGLYFITLCFAGRRRFGTNPRVAAWLVANLRDHAGTCGFCIHAYCVMPDHLHALVAGTTEESSLIKLVESFKQATAIEFTRRNNRRLWQVKYYDHILRRAESADRVAWYIWMNPVRKGLCREPSEYPFLGSLTEVGNRMLRETPALEWVPTWKEPECRAKDRGAT